MDDARRTPPAPVPDVMAVGARRPGAALHAACLHAADLDAALALLAGGPAPGVVLVDLAALGADPAAGVASLSAAAPASSVVVVATDLPAATVGALVAAGADDVADPGGPGHLDTVAAAARARAQRRASAARQLERTSLLHAYAADGWVVLGPGAQVLDVSPTPGATTTADAIRGQGLASLLPAADWERVRAALAGLEGRPGASVDLEVEVVDGRGRQRWLEVVMTNLEHEPAVGGVLANYWDCTSRVLAERSRRRMATLVASSSEAIISTTEDGTIASWNPAACRLYGWSEAEAVGQPISLIFPPDRLDELASLMGRVRGGRAIEGYEALRRRKDGSLVEVVIRVAALRGEAGRPVGFVSVTSDNTERVRIREEREAADLRFEAAFEQSPLGMVITDLAGRPTQANAAACDLLGMSREEVLGLDWGSSTRPAEVALRDRVVASARDGRDHAEEHRHVSPDGTVVWLGVRVSLVRDGRGRPHYFMLHMQDITEQRRLARELEHRALHDQLTGLPNRALLTDRLEHALATGSRSGRPTGVVFLDLDGFKHVNDALGHGLGDELLVEVARRLRRSVRDNDTVARFGGDEFVIVCEDVSLPKLGELAERVQAGLDAPHTLGGRPVQVSASLGLTTSRPASTPQSLLSEADAAMYRAKELGRHRSVVFDESLRARAAVLLEGPVPIGPPPVRSAPA